VKSKVVGLPLIAGALGGMIGALGAVQPAAAQAPLPEMVIAQAGAVKEANLGGQVGRTVAYTAEGSVIGKIASVALARNGNLWIGSHPGYRLESWDDGYGERSEVCGFTLMSSPWPAQPEPIYGARWTAGDLLAASGYNAAPSCVTAVEGDKVLLYDRLAVGSGTATYSLVSEPGITRQPSLSDASLDEPYACWGVNWAASMAAASCTNRFYFPGGPGYNQVYAAKSGERWRRITRARMDYGVNAPNPDGSRVAWVAELKGRAAIFTASIRGKNIKRVTRLPRYRVFDIAKLQWSADGTTIAFLDRSGTLRRVPAAGGSARVVLTGLDDFSIRPQ
jgi:hypothetical protein